MGFPTIDKVTGKAHYAPMSTFPLESDPIPEGKNGWQYEKESMYLECIQKWKEFSEDEKRRMRNTAVRTADQFSKESFAKRVERVYLAALEERKRRNVYAA